MSSLESIFEQVVQRSRDTAKLEGAVALLEWDEHTYLPAQGGAYRAEQITLLSGMIHARRTDPALGEQLQTLAASPFAADRSTPQGAAIAGWLRDYQRYVKLPRELVEAIARATSLGQQAWVAARQADCWTDFQPHLHEIVGLIRQQAQLLSGTAPAYDALLDQYEEGAQAGELATLFKDLREHLVKLLGDLQAAPEPPSGAAWQRDIPLTVQQQASQWIAEAIGYDFQRGRLDETAHPFCTTLGPSDCRILTRYHLDNFASGFYSTLHEAGHGMYEQGLPPEWHGMPPGAAASLGVHESQSRLWENFVGRSAPFWHWCLPQLKQRFGGHWDDLDADLVFRDANRAQASLVRVEADEVTYNLHILIRFEMEQELINGQLSVNDAPQAWNELYQRYLGIQPKSPKEGILQDVHWSAGLIGYFPTYTLGNLFAAQLMLAARRDLGDLDRAIAQGEFRPLLQWLRDNVHRHGRCHPPKSLIELATGQKLSAQPLVNYLRNKLEVVYGMV